MLRALWSKAWIRIAALITAGSVALAYVPVVEVISNSEPQVRLNVNQDGSLAPFAIENKSKLFSIKRLTPDCVVTFAIWKISGNLMMFYVDHKPPSISQTQLQPGGIVNYACELTRVFKAPVAHPAPAYWWLKPENLKNQMVFIDTELLEAKMRIDIVYETSVGPFSFKRKLKGKEYCGIKRGSNLSWSQGDTIAPKNDVSKEVDISSFYSGEMTRCFSERELREIFPEWDDHIIKPDKPGRLQYGMPANGPFK